MSKKLVGQRPARAQAQREDLGMKRGSNRLTGATTTLLLLLVPMLACKKGSDDSSVEKAASKTPVDPLEAYRDAVKHDLLERSWDNAKDTPPDDVVAGKLTTKVARLSKAAAEKYPAGALRPVAEGTQPRSSDPPSTLTWRPGKRSVAVLELCYLNEKGEWGRVSSITKAFYDKDVALKSLASARFAEVIAGNQRQKEVLHAKDQFFIPTYELTVKPLEGVLVIAREGSTCARFVSPDAKKDREFLSSVIHKEHWPDLEKKLYPESSEPNP